MTTTLAIQERLIARADNYHVYRRLLDLIGFTEGADRGADITKRSPTGSIQARMLISSA